WTPGASFRAGCAVRLEVDELLGFEHEQGRVVVGAPRPGSAHRPHEGAGLLHALWPDADDQRAAFLAKEAAHAGELSNPELRVQKLVNEAIGAVAARDNQDDLGCLVHTCSKCSTSIMKTVAPPTSTSTNAPIIAADSTMFGPAGIRRVRRSHVSLRIAITASTARSSTPINKVVLPTRKKPPVLATRVTR